MQDDIVRRSVFQDGKMYNVMEQDVEAYLKNNAELRAERSGMDRFKKATVAKHLMHTASVPLAFLHKMRNGQCCPDGKTYDFYSDDREEIRRAMIHMQLHHPECMVVEGKPIGRKDQKWHDGFGIRGLVLP